MILCSWDLQISLQLMSNRNKKLTALQSINHSLQNSLQKVRKIRQYGSEQRKQNPLLAKIGQLPFNRKFQVRKITQNQAELVETKSKFRSLRMHTQKLTRSPIKKNDSPYERSHTIQLKEIEKEDKYFFMTTFEKEETLRYEIYYIGPRRINSIKDFTNSNCEARVSPKDSIAYRYEIISGLGHGSFGQVFKAYDHKKKQMVALKIIRNQPKFNKQAKVEIKILQCVIMNDPKFRSNIVQLKHGFFFRGHACLVFQLLHINLYELLKVYKFNGLALDLIRKITIQVLQGLIFFNKHNIIHCDLKPENILLKQQNKTGVKIIDVGSGCYQSQQIYTYIQSRYYRAPEVILGIPYTTAIDIWSLGCILCQLFLGYPIFPGENEPQQLLMFMEVLGVPPSSLIQRGTRSSKFFEGKNPKIKANSKGKIRRPGTQSINNIFHTCEDSQFVDFVKKFLIWSPQDRITAQQAMLQPWILKGLPEDIKKQHINATKKQFSF